MSQFIQGWTAIAATHSMSEQMHHNPERDLMKRALLLLVLLSTYSLMPVKASGPVRAGELRPMKIIMTINHQSYEIALADNATAKAFVQQLPLTMTMEELNGNEKFADLPAALNSDPHKPGTIQQGDVMLYGNKTLVLFYETFQTSYSYTPIGKVLSTDNLKKRVGEGGIDVRFSRP
ncbi:cyclophilin-like fold protein [Pantoea agglomerans]|uniref:cyclophilin-like fold protein n=1 Tax=Enterobacter agglomerans TaxID=549 RepID=UPI000A91785D|nr:cyclophilin-like fold protein [Pantoea agglomerans]WHU90510.1 cyclophilin-like fold protein [Pantoea agglomerans pv. gypsophilae]